MLGAKSLLITLVVPLLLFGALDRIKRAFNKGDYEKTSELILKAYEKEPFNPGLFFLHAQLLFTVTYDQYEPDSAKFLVDLANKNFKTASSELKLDLAEQGISSLTLDSLAGEIEDHFYAEAISQISQEKIDAFVFKYPDSQYNAILKFKRDSLDFGEAIAIGTQASYISYIDTHPSSTFNASAEIILDSLRFEQLHKEGMLRNYYEFRQSYPKSQYLEQVEAYILNISTASHKVQDFETFIQNASTEKWKKKASDILYFFDNNNDLIQTDSIQRVNDYKDNILFPSSDDGLFGFIDADGSQQIESLYGDIQDRDKCQAVTDNWIWINANGEGRIILRDGTTLLRGIDDYQFISESVGLIKKGSDWYLHHKSGYAIISSPVEEVETFENQWLKVKQNGYWGLFTVLGVSIAEAKYEDIYQLGNFWVFEKEGQLAVYTQPEILKEVEDRGLSLAFKFDDLELIKNDLLIALKGERECLLNGGMEFLIPWGDHEIIPDPAGWYVRSARGFALYDTALSRINEQYYSYLESNDGWLAIQEGDTWSLIPRSGYLDPSTGYDSVKLINQFAALLFQNDSSKILFERGKELTLTTHAVRTFSDQKNFIEITNDGALGIYNRFGESVFEGMYEAVSFVTDTMMSVQSKGKVGLASTNGSFILNPIFDSLNEKDGLVLTLYNGKIGCYDLATNTMISPEYEARISKVGDYYYTKKGEYYGLLDANEEEVLPFTYNEIIYWNDTSFLVKTEDHHLLVNASGESLTDEFSSISLLYESDREKVYRYVQEGKFGLRSNQNGDFLPPEFTDILNIGTKDQPIYFADQHLSSAGYHVVSYLNILGDLIYSKAYRKREFEKIICDD